MAHRVDGLPSDNHGHEGRLAGAGREFQRDARELEVCCGIRVVDPLEDALVSGTLVRRHFHQPNQRFDGFSLTEKRTNATKLVVAPVLEQPRRFGCDSPICRIRTPSPVVDVLADSVDIRGGVILLSLGRNCVE